MARKLDRVPNPSPSPTPPEFPERWSAQRKQEVVLRLLRGEPLDQVSGETRVPAHALWGCSILVGPSVAMSGKDGARKHRERRDSPPSLAHG